MCGYCFSLIFTLLLIVACEAQTPASTSVSPTPMPTDPPSVLPIATSNFVIKPNAMRLKVGETHRIESITEVSSVEQTLYQDYSRYHFSSENTEVATVDDNGVVTAVKPVRPWFMWPVMRISMQLMWWCLWW